RMDPGAPCRRQRLDRGLRHGGDRRCSHRRADGARRLMLAAFIAALLALTPVSAQVVYKSTLPDGRVVYGDKPDPAAVKVEESIPDTSRRGLGGSTPREAEALQQMEKARAARESADARVQAAYRALQEAEAARDG